MTTGPAFDILVMLFFTSPCDVSIRKGCDSLTMDSDSRVSCFLFLVLLALAALSAVAETAFASVSRSRVKTLADRGDERAERADRILDDFDSAISTLLIVTNLTHISAASLVTVTVTRLWGLGAVTAGTIITTIVVFFAGEMLPKSAAKKNPEKFAVQLSGFVAFFMKLFRPLSALLARIGALASRLSKTEPELSVTEDELYDIIEDMAEEGSIDEDQEDLISSVLDFTDVRARNIFTPIEDAVGIDIDMPKDEAFAFITEQRHSRILVYRKAGAEGGQPEVAGVLQIRKYLKAYMKKGRVPAVATVMDKPYYVSASQPADELLQEMSAHRQNLAVVRTSDGTVTGIVTVEDIVEELVGEILDEKDVQSADALREIRAAKARASVAEDPAPAATDTDDPALSSGKAGAAAAGVSEGGERP